jgi:hypothetical protein
MTLPAAATLAVIVPGNDKASYLPPFQKVMNTFTRQSGKLPAVNSPYPFSTHETT